MTFKQKDMQEVIIEKAASYLLATVENLNAAAVAKVNNTIATYGHFMWNARMNADLHIGLAYGISRDGLSDAYVKHMLSRGEWVCKYVTDSSRIMPILGYGIEDFITKSGNYHE